MPSLVVAEGAVDRAIVTALSSGLNVPEPEADESPGREAAMKRAAVAAKLIGHRILLLLDMNGYSLEDLHREVGGVFQREWGVATQRRGEWWEFGSSTVRMVAAGLPGDEELRSLGIVRFTSDDYLFKLVLDDGALRAFCDGENRLAHRPERAPRA